MKPIGRRVYLSARAAKGLEEVGKKYIQQFRNGKRTSYNRACLYLLQLIGIAERLKIGEPIKGCDDD